VSEEIKISDPFIICRYCSAHVPVFSTCTCLKIDYAFKAKISLDTYIKMQCDVACMLRSNEHSFCQASAKEMVDMILKLNNVEVER
jgi:hypothetical protein